MRKPLCFLQFLSVLKGDFRGQVPRARWTGSAAYTRIHAQIHVFFAFLYLTTRGFYEAVGGRNIGRQNGQHAYTWANVGFFYNVYVQIRSA